MAKRRAARAAPPALPGLLLVTPATPTPSSNPACMCLGAGTMQALPLACGRVGTQLTVWSFQGTSSTGVLGRYVVVYTTHPEDVEGIRLEAVPCPSCQVPTAEGRTLVRKLRRAAA